MSRRTEILRATLAAAIVLGLGSAALASSAAAQDAEEAKLLAEEMKDDAVLIRRGQARKWAALATLARLS